jgi:tetratricopeptide (TPR) repeat protein
MKTAAATTRKPWIHVSAAIACALLLLAGCAGAPGEIEEEAAAPDPVLMETARELIERGDPEHLREAVELLREPAKRFSEAGQRAAFAVELFEILYPELSGTGYLFAAAADTGSAEAIPAGAASIPQYAGPYRETLGRARRGQPPAGGVLAFGEDFFDLVVPTLFLARLGPSDPGSAEACSAVPGFSDAGSAEAQGTVPDPSGYLALLEQAEERNPVSVLPPYLQGRIHDLQGADERAVELYRQSVNRAASFYPGRQRLAFLLLRHGRTAEATTLLQRGLEHTPEVVSLRYALAQSHYRSGQLDEAAAELAQVLLREPEHGGAMLLRARVLAAEGNWSRALRLLDLLLYRHPDDREAYLLAARLRYEEAKNPEGALDLLSEAENQFPDAPEFPELAGRIFLETGRSGEGPKKLQQALDLDPGRISTLRLLLSNAVRMRRWLQAAIYLSEILEQEQSEADLLQAIEIYQSLGDPAQVLYYAEQLYDGNPTGENLVIYARALLSAGKTEQAAALIDRGLEQAARPAVHSSLLALKASLATEEAPEEALALLRQALMEHPENYTALVTIAELYMEKNELRRASLYLKQALALDPNNAALQVRLQSIEKALGTRNSP